MKVLFVDDEPRVLEALQRMLFDAAGSWEVETASSGHDALNLLSSSRFDVIVTDMRMPGMDGAQLLEQVHERWPSMTRIVLSGQTDQEHALKALGRAHQFLSKPCDPRTLTQVVENAFHLQALTPNERIRGLAASVHRLPSVAKVHERILKLLDTPEGNLRDAADLVAQDPSLAAKVMRIVNTAFFARGSIVQDVRTATSRIGMDLLRALVLSERASGGRTSPRIERVQARALDAASLACKFLPESERRAAFTAGLLCDVGTLVLEQGAPDEISAVYEYAKEAGIAQHVAEKEMLGSSHADVGGYVLGLWGVPPSIVEAVLGHHVLGRDPSLLSAAVNVAHHIVAGETPSDEAIDRAGVFGRIDELKEMLQSEREVA